MSNQFKFELNRAGVAELLHSDELRAVLETEAKRRNPSSGDYETVTFNGRNRVVAKIQTASDRAVKDNLENNTLLKALGRH